ncbi:MAG: NAD(P)-dependent alcohol dehydrogenase [Alphaproteobacteria bacterium]|nr:NAD(P)-dependent alcohol dehydrogenase [Alphaproteobacteria bacterium]
MRALVLDRYGGADAFRVADVPVPEPGAGEVRVRVHAASINSWDWEIARGQLFARMESPFRPARAVLGGDIAGTVDAVGTGVTRFASDDAVFGDVTSQRWGGFAEYALARADTLQRKPDHLDFVTASTLPQAGALALEAVFKHRLGLGSDVLVIGGGGGVGSFAIQLAKLRGARVTAIDSAQKSAVMEAAGADIVFDRDNTDVRRQPARYDLVIDPVARHGLWSSLALLKPGGCYAVIGGRVGALVQTGLLGSLIAPRFGKTAGLVFWRQNDAGEMAELVERIRAGRLKPMIERVYPLEDGVAAFRHFASGRALGKLVIAPHTD